MPTTTERVEYRKWPSTGNIIALYPDRPWPAGVPGYCEGTSEAGETVAADFKTTMRVTIPVTEAEFALARSQYD